MRPTRGKRGQDHPLYLILFEIFALLMFGGVMTAYGASVAADTIFWKLYFTNDLSMLTTIIAGSPGTVAFSYPYISAMPLKSTLAVTLAGDNVQNPYQAHVIKVSDTGTDRTPVFLPFAFNTHLTINTITVDESRTFQIINDQKSLQLLVVTEDPSVSCPPFPSPYDPTLASFSFSTLDPALNPVIDLNSPLSAPARIRADHQMTQAQMNSPTPLVGILLSTSPGAQSAIYYSKSAPAANTIACAFRARMSIKAPQLVPLSTTIAAVDGSEFLNSDIASFLAKPGLRIIIVLPSSASSQQDALSESLAWALGAAIAPAQQSTTP